MYLFFDKANNKYLFIVFLFTYLGYYALLLVFANFFELEFSRKITIPLRIIICVTLILFFFKNNMSLKWSNEFLLFFSFVLCFLIRLSIDYVKSLPYYLSYPEVLFYFLSFCVLPFIVISNAKISSNNINSIFFAFLVGGFSFSFLTIFFYGNYIGEVTRLSSSTINDSVLSPLSLSYCSSLIISSFTFYLLHNKVAKSKRLIIIFVILLSVVPFFLGASRGSLFALITSFLVYFYFMKNLYSFLRILLITSIFLFLLVYLNDYFDSGLLNRFLGISDAVASNSSSANRLVVWKISFNQFLENPFLGDKLEVNNWKNYPHNIFLEVLQTTGIIGFIPFFILIIKTWIRVFFIGKYYKKYFWIAVIFIQSFVQNIFSGSIFTSSWFWTSTGLIFMLYCNINKIGTLSQNAEILNLTKRPLQ